MESISQRVPQGERGPYRWGRGDQPLYGEGQGGGETPQDFSGWSRIILSQILRAKGLQVKFVIGELWLLEVVQVEEVGWLGGAVPRTLPGHCLSSKD